MRKILFMYALGMTTRGIVATFKKMYSADLSVALIKPATSIIRARPE
jgi:transposase-like protein